MPKNRNTAWGDTVHPPDSSQNNTWWMCPGVKNMQSLSHTHTGKIKTLLSATPPGPKCTNRHVNGNPQSCVIILKLFCWIRLCWFQLEQQQFLILMLCPHQIQIKSLVWLNYMLSQCKDASRCDFLLCGVNEVNYTWTNSQPVQATTLKKMKHRLKINFLCQPFPCKHIRLVEKNFRVN